MIFNKYLPTISNLDRIVILLFLFPINLPPDRTDWLTSKCNLALQVYTLTNHQHHQLDVLPPLDGVRLLHQVWIVPPVHPLTKYRKYQQDHHKDHTWYHFVSLVEVNQA